MQNAISKLRNFAALRSVQNAAMITSLILATACAVVAGISLLCWYTGFNVSLLLDSKWIG